MRLLLAALLCLTPLLASADPHAELYRSAGWAQHQVNFSKALQAAQQRYQGNLPDALYRVMVESSNRRFAADALQSRVAQHLREQLRDPQAAQAFFDSPLGRKVVRAELQASASEEVALGVIPRNQASAPRQALAQRLGQALPASAATAEVSLAIAGIAADSLGQMIPGLADYQISDNLLDGPRQKLIAQIDSDLGNSLLFIYRDLNDQELAEFVTFAESAEGQAYYQAALGALRAALNPAPASPAPAAVD